MMESKRFEVYVAVTRLGFDATRHCIAGFVKKPSRTVTRWLSLMWNEGYLGISSPGRNDRQDAYFYITDKGRAEWPG